MTPQQIDAMKLAHEALERTQNEGYNLPGIAIREAITASKEALAEHAMREVQRLGQEIEQESVGVVHHKLTSTLGADYEQVAVFVRPLEPGTKLYTHPPQPEQEPCVHAKTPKGCYRVRCQLGDKCVDDEMSFRTAPPQRTEQELVCVCGAVWDGQELMEAPPQRTWVGLTEDERDHLAGLHLYAVRGQVEAWIEGVDDFAQAIEAKLKEKNCG